MILKFPNRLDFRSHNNRCYNFILTYDQITDEFSSSTPRFQISWKKGTSIPQEIIKEAKKSEMTIIKKFIANPDTY